MTVHLEPCPLCASDKIKAHYIRDGESLGCQNCGCRVHDFQPNAGDKCIEKWNRRDAEMTTLRYCEREWQKEREAFFDMIRDKVIAAYAQGAMDVHENWQEDRDPDFTEAAHDYYASVGNADTPESHSPNTMEGEM